ncbi:MAG: hypothetical protein ACLSHG_06355 [Oscillospiraceae bacterium]
MDNAVIMAAGMSSRFAPLSDEKPKALLKVKGEVAHRARDPPAAGGGMTRHHGRGRLYEGKAVLPRGPLPCEDRQRGLPPLQQPPPRSCSSATG